MTRYLLGLALLPFINAAALAAEPLLLLSDTQMEEVTAGAVFLFTMGATDITNSGTIMINIDPIACTTCFINIRNEAFTLQAQFGPVQGANNFSFLGNGL